MLTFEDADKLVRAFFRAHEGAQPPGEEMPALNRKGFGAAQFGEGEVYFEYHVDQRTLECSALIYRFRDAPKPGVIDGFKAEEKAGTDTGGGTIDFETENNGLFLTRMYPNQVPADQFVKEIDALMIASVDWAKDVLPRVADKVFRGR